MNIIEIRKLDGKKLASAIMKTRGEIAELRRKIHMGETTNVRMLRNKRKDLARMLSVMSEQFSREVE